MTTISVERLNSDVTVYARHRPACPSADRDVHPPMCRCSKCLKCQCPKWLYIKNGCRRVTARTTSWKTAQIEAQRLMDSQDPVKRELAELKRVKERETVPIAGAIEKWLASKTKAREETLISYGHTLRQMCDHLAGQGIFYLHEITADRLADWSIKQWKDLSVRTERLRRQHVRGFFFFCIDRMRWLAPDQNPTTGIVEQREDRPMPVVPFERDQYNAILGATHKYDEVMASNWRGVKTGARLRALIQLMRWSGLAIRDAVTLERTRLGDDDVLKVSRAKTGTWVTVPIPHLVAEDLRNVLPGDNPHPDYFFWSGTSKKTSATNNWNNQLRALWPLVKWPRGEAVKQPHSHMFRHTFAKEFLQAEQGDIYDLADLLGHTSVKTTEKHYKAFVPARAERLNQKVIASFAAQGAPGYEAKRKSVGRVTPGRQRKAQAR